MARCRPALSLLASLLCASLLGVSGPAQADGLADVQELHRTGKPAEALKRLDGLLAAKPTDARLRFERGLLLADLKRNKDAIAVFVKLTQDHPALPEPHNNLAVLYAEAGQMDKAKASLEAAMRSKPNYGTAFQNLGDVYARMASRAYAKALQINDKDHPSAPRLAMVRSLYEPMPDAGTLVASAKPVPVPTPPPPPPSPVVPTPSAPPVVTPPPTEVRPKPPVSIPPAPPAGPTPAQLAEESRAKAAAAAADAERKKVAEAERKKAAAEAERKKAAEAEKDAEKAEKAKDAKDSRELLNAVRDWAKAWTNQDLDGYFAAYEPGFSGTEGSAKAWQATRKARIMSKSGIDITLSNVKMDVRGKEATVSFRQTYESGALKVSSQKRLEMVRTGGQWLIRKESVGG